MPLADQKEKWWVVVMGVGLDPELSNMVRVLRSGYLLCSDSEGIRTLPGTEGQRVGSTSGR